MPAQPLRLSATHATLLRPTQPPAPPSPAAPATPMMSSSLPAAAAPVADQAAKLRAMAAQLQPKPAQPKPAQFQPKPAPARSPLAARPAQPAQPSRSAGLAASAIAAADPEVLPRAVVFAVTSGKGGVGKSNVSVNLAITLAQSGKRVILLDADLGLANADVLCNVEVRANLAHVVARQRTIDEVMVDAPGGFKLVGGASGLAKMADLSDFDRRRLVAALDDLEHRADVIIIDTGAGISPTVLDFTRAADHVLVVTTPEPTAITDAYAAIKVLSKTPRPGGEPRRVSLLVNQALTPVEGAQVYERVAKVARQFLGATVYDAGHVLRDDAVTTAVRSRQPFMLSAPRSGASACIRRLATRLGQLAPAEQGGGFFERMTRRWFGD